MNRIPLSLERPFLRDAIVEFRFRSLISASLLPGLLYERLRTMGWQAPSVASSQAVQLGFDVLASASPIPQLRNGDVRLQLMEDRVAFNIAGHYPGWSSYYRPLIHQTLEHLVDPDTVQLTQLGLRFINELPHPDVFALVARFDPGPIPKGLRTQRRAIAWDLTDDDRTAIKISLASDVRLTSGEIGSLLDVDLRWSFPEGGSDQYAVRKRLERLHDRNKQIVFGHVLPENFVADYGPTYLEN